METISRLQKVDPEKLTELCRMHLTFALDLHDDEFAVLVDDKFNEKKKTKNYFSRFVKEKSIAEMPLNQQTISHIYQIIEFLGREKNICIEGLFRKTGSLVRQNELKTLLRIGEDIDFSAGQYTAHDCACVLKCFLAELHEPLLSEAHYSAHCQITDMLNNTSPSQRRMVLEKQLKATKLLLLLLPDDNYCLLKYLLLLLYQIHCQKQNNMNSKNLAIVFAPHIICPRKMPLEEMKENLPRMAKCITFLIDYALLLFDPPKELVEDVSAYLKVLPNEGQLFYSVKESSPVRTAVTFCERVAADDLATDYTAKALSDLHAYVEKLPSSPRKRKLIKQLQKDSKRETQTRKHTRSRSVGDAIKRHVLRNSHKKIEDMECRHSAYNMALPLSKSIESINIKSKSADALLDEKDSSRFVEIRKNFLRTSRKKVKKLVNF